ncbi:MAG: ABC transporter substrate-binding protein [Limnochordia bacterium]|jgi:ABC-type glycerol-3-phosphate transport system substrate-binding protein
MGRKRISAPLVAVAGLMLLSLLWKPWIPRLKVGNVRINPKAAISDNKDYHITVWDYDLLLPWSKVSYEEALKERVEAFHQEYPNIVVHVIQRPWHEDDGPLRDALEQGEAPDVVNMPNGVRLLSRRFQVPLQHYLRADERADLLPAAAQAATLQHLWAFPSRIHPARWIIRAEDPLADPPAFRTWDQWSEALAENRTKSGGSGLAANVLDPDFFRHLMISATGHSLLGNDGTVQWTEADIEKVADQVLTWVEKGLIPADVEKAARSRLARFWDGKALAIAPTNPWLLHHILRRVGMMDSPDGHAADSTAKPLKSVERSLYWTAPPQIGETPWVAADIYGYAVFRQAKYKGDDHTRAAALVAAYLSREMGTWVAIRTFSVPAHQSSLERWFAESLLPEADMRLLLQWCKNAVPPPIDDRLASLEARIMAETVVPKLVAVLKGEMSVSHFAREIRSIPVAAWLRQ